MVEFLLRKLEDLPSDLQFPHKKQAVLVHTQKVESGRFPELKGQPV